MSETKKAVIQTSKGAITLELWGDVAPNHVANFEKLAADGFYNDLIFHRVIPNFMVQTGCPEGRGTGDAGYKLDAEFNERSFEKGVLGMARAQDPNSAGSQFFICVADAPNLDGEYTAFGKVLEGQDVADAISCVARNGNDVPDEPITMESISVE